MSLPCPKVFEQKVKDIELLKDECAPGGLMMEEGITSITFFKGNFQPASDALLAQFLRVVSSNPWLAGRLVKTKQGIRLRHPINPVASGDYDSLVSVVPPSSSPDTPTLTPNTPYVDMCNAMYKSKKQIIVPSGNASLDKDKPVTLLTLVATTPLQFALVFSMSHVVGDGRTYYEIFKMLSPGAAIRELTSDRIMSFSESMRDTCGRKEMEWADSTSTAIMYTLATLPTMLGCGAKARCYAFHLDDARLAELKRDCARDGGVPYVTTNDILTSGFFNACGSRIGMMGFDCREKLDECHRDLAGNYVSALILDSDVFGTPARLRRMYSSRPYKTTGRPLPKCCCGAASFAMVTNWSSFAGEMVALRGCEMIIHLPVLNPAYCVYDIMIPFASAVGKKGVLCWTVSTDEDGLREAMPLGDRVSKDMFP
eukprot:CAMPEP_0172498320 /NCGR_PEP_ID=MMETSP1066-20121228/112157_1 /TAXON_ID=671091 /ORGANISM="Coscinodiscus wailesii, Strain CCMP2513" /LENGTH=425 /DNA_ID=CAMNT_0013271551 /DNA_START=86 /DNA_END=1363 /DNA_ORIENTATION=+